jgi:pimeloyl-ACP methyl ester carboxylesterase
MSAQPFLRAGHGSPLVLLHGLTGSWRIWRPVIPLLSGHHDVFVPSLAGHHGGPVLPNGASIAALTDALERTLDEAGLDTAHVAGNSLGGWLALELARRGRARSVVALSPAGAWASPRELRRISRMFLTAARTTPRVLPRLGWLVRRPRGRRLLLRQVMERGDRIPAADAAELFADYAACSIVEELIATFGRDGGFRGDLVRAEVPIRIAWAAHDRTIPFAGYGRPMADLLPGAEITTLAGVGHVPMYDDPALVARTILDMTRPTDQEATAR